MRIERQGCYWGSDSTGVTGTCTTTITWNKAVTKGTEIRVYGVTGCLLAVPGRTGQGSCLVKHTPVPASVRSLIARAPITKGEIVWTGPAWRNLMFYPAAGGKRNQISAVDRHDDETYFAIVVAAYNAAGHSRFIIADNGAWCYATGCKGWGP